MAVSESINSSMLVQQFTTKEALDLLAQNKGAAYFIPEGYVPLLVPEDCSGSVYASLKATQPACIPIPISLGDTRLPSLVVRAPKRHTTNHKLVVAKKPPRPPNAFILYRKEMQPTVLASHGDLCNNDVSRVIGEMWQAESSDVKQRYYLMSQECRDKHQQQYPGYRYAPRKAGEKRRRTKEPKSSREFMAQAASEGNIGDLCDASHVSTFQEDNLQPIFQASEASDCTTHWTPEPFGLEMDSLSNLIGWEPV